MEALPMVVQSRMSTSWEAKGEPTVQLVVVGPTSTAEQMASSPTLTAPLLLPPVPELPLEDDPDPLAPVDPELLEADPEPLDLELLPLEDEEALPPEPPPPGRPTVVP
jgi:hypothetical protein